MAYEAHAGDTSQEGSRRTTGPLPNGRNSSVPYATETSHATDDGYQNLVFTDPVAFRYLEEDPSTAVVERQRTLTGFEIYIVEQWACSRVHPTFVINSYTGDPLHAVVVGVLRVPTDERTWSPRLRVYFNAMSQFHARKRETPAGVLMVTNLSSFPSSLTVIAVPDGDVRNHRKDFIVNENLKRLGCAGRAGLNLEPPSSATETKFYQLYRTSERVPFYEAVMEIIWLCQTALTVFGKLPPEYVDGLLCDITERAVNDWWTDIGTDLYNIEPSDGILGPTTVSALLGTLMGARNRLHACGAPVSKDAFNAAGLKRGIGSFQKSQRLDRTRRLDHQTLDRLHRVTAKAAGGGGWTVPRAVKSTVAEFGGKGGEMVMEFVGGRDKAGIGEVETLDIDRFIHLVNGERSKWLWLGKPRKTGGDDFQQANGDDDLVFTSDDRGGYVWTSKKRDAGSDYGSGRPSLDTEHSWKHTERPAAVEEKESYQKHLPKRSVTDKVSDARAGLGRIRDAVGIPNLRHQQRKLSKESVDLEPSNPPTSGVVDNGPARDASSILPTSDKLDKPNVQLSTEAAGVDPSRPDNADLVSPERSPEFPERSQGRPQEDETRMKKKESGGDAEEPSHERAQESTLVKRFLRHPRSAPYIRCDDSTRDRSDTYLPRHLSFSAVEDALLASDDPFEGAPSAPAEDMAAAEAILHEDMAISDVKLIGEKIGGLAEQAATWAEDQVSKVERVDGSAQSQLGELNAMYQDKFEEYNVLRADALDVIAREGGNLTEHAKKVELLGAKLEYEVHAMESRIEEVEEGLGEYELNIVQLERRIQNLVQVDEQKDESSWFRWAIDQFQSRTRT